MPFRLLNQRRALVLAVVALLGASQLKPGAALLLSVVPRHILAATVGVPSLPLKALSDALRRPAPLTLERGTLTQLEKNYDDLLRYNAALKSELVLLKEELAHYKIARQQLHLEGVDFQRADVSSWDNDRTRQVITINSGAKRGLRPGLVVADWSSFSLVGRVIDTGPVTATVELITSPRTRLMVRPLPTTPQPMPGDFVLPIILDKKGRYFVGTIKADDPVKEGYLAHLVDLTWPPEAAGFVVGKVVKIEPLPENPYLYRRIVVQPIQELANLTVVQVVVPVEQDKGRRTGR